MSEAPAWFAQLRWGGGSHVADLNLDRIVLPDFPGCYVFTVGPQPIAPDRVLYVGQARVSLRGRISCYLVDWRKTKRREGHKGRGFILEARSAHGDHGVYLRWVEYGGGRGELDILEASLINYLNPPANDREDDARHPLLDDSERLDPRFIR